jgi:hypothetical protein
MTRIRKLTVGGLVGVMVTFALGGIASADPAASTSPTTTTSTASSSAPSSSTPSSSKPAKSHTLTGGEIWRIVHPAHPISCAHATKELKRVRAADAAAAKRLARFQSKTVAAQARRTATAARHAKHTAAQVRGFQKLESAGQALIKRIETKCPASAPAA